MYSLTQEHALCRDRQTRKQKYVRTGLPGPPDIFFKTLYG